MSFLRIDDSHLQVPGKMDVDEMAFLAALAARVPKGGHIVEIGPFYGRSTRVMGLANRKAHITSIDTFEDVPWTRNYAARHPAIPPFSQSAFALFTRDVPRVTAFKGPSPQVAADWSHPIDMYFEDAVHGNPVLAQNIRFWTQHLKPGGIACGHDYTLRFPDIKREVDALAAQWGTQVSVVGSLWALRKPGLSPAQTGADTPLMPALSDQPRLKLHVKNKRSGLHKAADGYWCGAHLEVDRMVWFQLAPPDLPEGLRLECRVGHPDHGVSEWVPAGTRVQLTGPGGKPKPFDRVAVRLVGPNPKRLQVGYRVSARQIGQGGAKRSGTSALMFDGAWAEARSRGLAINALSIALYESPPPDAQAAFPARETPSRSGKILRRLVRKLTEA